MTPRDADARQFYRVAFHRLEDGRLILDELDRPAASLYLTGYAVECMLKALILEATSRNERSAVLAGFRGAGAHDLHWLREGVVSRGVRIPPEIAGELALAASGWSPELRYVPGPGDRKEAERYWVAAERVLRWANERI